MLPGPRHRGLTTKRTSCASSDFSSFCIETGTDGGIGIIEAEVISIGGGVGIFLSFAPASAAVGGDNTGVDGKIRFCCLMADSISIHL